MLKRLVRSLVVFGLGTLGIAVLSSHNTLAGQSASTVLGAAVELNHKQANEVLFFCRTENNKLIELYDFGETIQYSFGPEDAPEIVLNVPRDQAATYQWAGVGRSIYYSVEIPNQNTVYNVFISQDRLTEGRPITGGVDVLVNDEYVASVYCADENILSNLEGVDLEGVDLKSAY